MNLFWLNLNRSVHCFDCCFVSDVKWWIHVSFMVMNGRKKSALFLWNVAKHSIGTFSRRCFCYIVSKCGKHLAHSLLMSKFSVNMQCTALFKMPTMFSSGHNVQVYSSIVCSFCTFNFVDIYFCMYFWNQASMEIIVKDMSYDRHSDVSLQGFTNLLGL